MRSGAGAGAGAREGMYSVETGISISGGKQNQGRVDSILHTKLTVRSTLRRLKIHSHIVDLVSAKRRFPYGPSGVPWK